ncbi:MAG: hypothetical protein MK214_08640 [Thalassotalea sp.]|nr:hypothetical protein [Thalassotalea sp.]
MAVKMWTDDQLIKSLPYYLKIKSLKAKSHEMKSATKQVLNWFALLNIDERIAQIEQETAFRFSYQRVKSKAYKYEQKLVLLASLERKSKQAAEHGNTYAQSLLEQEIAEIINH